MVNHEEATLPSHPGDIDTLPQASDNAISQFWGFKGTRAYMEACYVLVSALLQSNTKQAVQASLDHTLDLIRLDRRDTAGMRNFVPSLFLRLGRYQKCYDFCKFWATNGNEEDYD